MTNLKLNGELLVSNKMKQVNSIKIWIAVFGLFSVSASAARIDPEDLSLAETAQNTPVVQAATAGNRVAEFKRYEQLRCWQEGQLIAAESGWNPGPNQKFDLSFTRGSQKLTTYSFGETFCIYIGEQ